MTTIVEKTPATASPGADRQTAVRIENLWKKYGDLEAVRGI